MKNLTLFNFFVPQKCPVCREILPLGDEGDGVMCRICRTKWESEKRKACPDCGNDAKDCRCMPRIMQDAGVDELIKLCFYDLNNQSAADKLTLYMKDYYDRRVFRFAASELCELLEKYLSEKRIKKNSVVLTYSPRSRKMLENRGFDQACMIVKQLSKQIGCPYDHLIVRKLFTKRQKGLTRDKRSRNAKKSFKIANGIDLKGYTVVLVDDIVTTGASLANCTRLLKGAGAKRVICLAIARTERKINIDTTK